jgi:hypothetical protein
MYFEDSITVIFIVILLLGVPLLLRLIKNDAFNNFHLSRLTKAFNRTLIIQIIIGVVILLASAVVDKIFYSNGHENNVAEIIIQTSYMYVIIGCFYYLPALGILNLINVLVHRRLKNKM